MMKKKILVVTAVFAAVGWISGSIFDSLWASRCYIPLTELDDVYRPPREYDNIAKIKLKMVDEGTLGIMGNKKFAIIPEATAAPDPRTVNNYHTVSISYPNEPSGSLKNRIFLTFEDYAGPDSIHLITTKFVEKGLQWNQIFLSSVAVSQLNSFDGATGSFEVDPNNYVDRKVLSDNDTLINLSIAYFNAGKDTMRIHDCGEAGRVFKAVCDRFELPCRIITLQNGNSGAAGLGKEVGYPLHVVCEVYSSRLRKWYVIDPSFGLRFGNSLNGNYLNAVEISNRNFFKDEQGIVKDPILFTVRNPADIAYFNYYNNVLYSFDGEQSKLVEVVRKYLYKKSNLTVFHFSNELKPGRNALYYVGLKSVMYAGFGFVYLSTLIFLLSKRIHKDKKLKSQ
jgi:hypothetical protein